MAAIPIPPPREQQNQKDQAKHTYLTADFQKPPSAHPKLRSTHKKVQSQQARFKQEAALSCQLIAFSCELINHVFMPHRPFKCDPIPPTGQLHFLKVNRPITRASAIFSRMQGTIASSAPIAPVSSSQLKAF
jgi:hypothetical protein